MLPWNREGYGFRMRTITPSSIKNEPLDVLRRGLPVASLTAQRSTSAQTVGSLLIREYENIVDTIVQRTREQERIVREWDIEIERLTERQYRMYYDDVVREFNQKIRDYCIAGNLRFPYLDASRPYAPKAQDPSLTRTGGS